MLSDVVQRRGAGRDEWRLVSSFTFVLAVCHALARTKACRDENTMGGWGMRQSFPPMDPAAAVWVLCRIFIAIYSMYGVVVK
jgi:hypothetical protein